MKKLYGQIYTMPLMVWITLFFTVPMLIILVISFMTRAVNGGVELKLSLEAYQDLFNKYILIVTGRTLLIALGAALIAVLLAIPTSYYMARSRHKDLFLLLIIIPFWTNFLIRIYAWITILGNNGFLNNFLLNTGIIQESIRFLYNPWAVLIVTVYTYLPFGILPLYGTIEKFDFSLLDAAMDLGASRFQAIPKVLIPNIMPGITTAVIFTFIPAFGNYAIPQLVGGNDSLMLGNIISRELIVTRNWPLSAAISVMFTFLTIAGILIFMRVNRPKTDELRKVKEDV